MRSFENVLNIPDYIKLKTALQMCIGIRMILKASNSCSDQKYSSLFPFHNHLTNATREW